MKWPTGKYNGFPIGGISIKIEFNIFRFRAVPYIRGVSSGFLFMIHWLGFSVWIEASYKTW